MLNLIFGRKPGTADDLLQVGSRSVPLRLAHHPWARRYLLRLLPDGTARVTIPRGGSFRQARRFAEGQTDWLERQLRRLAENPSKPVEWQIGSVILFRGEKVVIQAVEPGIIQIGNELVKTGTTANLRPAIHKHLRRLATNELPPRLFALAARQGLRVERVTVRSQRTRWGSCSRRGTISLNWRLIQVPEFVCDYILLHELMHLRQMNHSAKFWREVQNVCPGYPAAERWLKSHPGLLG